MSQSRAMSMLEATSNVALGYVLAVVTQLLAFPVFGLAVSLPQSAMLGAIFSAVSLVRAYGLRRFFNWLKG